MDTLGPLTYTCMVLPIIITMAFLLKCKVWLGLIAIVGACVWSFLTVLSLFLIFVLQSIEIKMYFTFFCTVKQLCKVVILCVYIRHSAYFIYSISMEKNSLTSSEIVMFNGASALGFALEPYLLSLYLLIAHTSGSSVQTGCTTAWSRLVLYPLLTFFSNMMFYFISKWALCSHGILLYTVSFVLLVLLFSADVCEEITGNCSCKSVFILFHSSLSAALLLHNAIGRRNS